MRLYVWVHDRTFHSWSMIEEPCLHTSMYNKATAIVIADSEEQAIALLTGKDEGWRAEDLRMLRPQVIELDNPSVVFRQVQYI